MNKAKWKKRGSAMLDVQGMAVMCGIVLKEG